MSASPAKTSASPVSGAGAPPDALQVSALRLQSSQLFGNAREVIIVHGGREYRLRVTSNGKLILTA